MKIAGLYPQPISRGPQGEIEFFEPLGLEYVLGQVAHENDTRLFTLYNKSEEEVVDEITRFSPKVLAVSCMTPQINTGLRIVNKIRRCINTKTVFGGYHPTNDFFLLSNPNVDYTILGEGEIVFSQLIKSISSGDNFPSLPGLMIGNYPHYKKSDLNKRRITDLDSLRRPLRPDFLRELRNYGTMYPIPEIQTGMASINFSRGCLFDCSFCSSESLYGRGVVYRNPNDVVKELKELKDLGINTFLFTDLNITSNPNKTKELCKKVIDADLGIYWEALSNICTADDPELLQLMRQAGCRKIGWGIESLNKDILHDVNKPLASLNQTYDVLKKSEKAGIINTGFYIIGFPIETPKIIRGYIPDLTKLPLHRIRFTVFTPFLGTRAFEENGVQSFDWELYDTTHLVFPHKNLSQGELESLRRELTEEITLSKQYKERIKRFVQRFPEYNKVNFGGN